MAETITREEFFEAVKEYVLRFFPDAPEWLVTAYFSDPEAKSCIDIRYSSALYRLKEGKYAKKRILDNCAATAAENIRLCNGEISFDWYERNKDNLAQGIPTEGE